MREINLKFIDNIEIDGVDSKDYPDFTDAFASSAVWTDSGKELGSDELIMLTEVYPEIINKMAFESLVG